MFKLYQIPEVGELNNNLTPIRSLLNGTKNVLIIPSGEYEVGKEYTANTSIGNIFFYFGMFGWEPCDVNYSWWHDGTWNAIDFNVVLKLSDTSMRFAKMRLLYKQTEPRIFKIEYVIRCVFNTGNPPTVSSQTTGNIQMQLTGIPNLYHE